MPNFWSEGSFNLQGAQLHYYRAGAQSKPKLVLAHGFSDMGLCWQPQAGALLTEWDILMPDARGHGLSQRVQPGEKTDMPADLAGLMRGLDFAPAVVVGHSMGGLVAGELAARFPSLVRALILEDPAWLLPEPESRGGSIGGGPMAEWTRSLALKTLEQLIEECRQEHPSWPDIVVRRWCEGKKQLDQNFPLAVDASWGPWRQTARAIQCPTLLITAEPALGGIISPDTAAHIRALNPRIEVVQIPGVGHHVRFAAACEYEQIVRDFLSRLSPAGS